MQYLLYLAIGIATVLLQVLVSPFLSIAGVSPDFLVIFIVYLAIKEGQFIGESYAFVLGASLDMFSSGIFGAHALSATVAAFLVGFSYNPERADQNVRNWPFLVLTLLGALVNNALYYFMLTRRSEIGFSEFAFRYGAVGALYTVVVAILPLLYLSRKRTY